MSTSRAKNAISSLILLSILFQATSCGYFMHPERRGNSSKRNIDVGVVVLDSVGLLFFLVPGIIAFAVDYSNGTLYLPSGGHRKFASVIDVKQDRAIALNKEDLSDSAIEKAIKEHTGVSVSLENNRNTAQSYIA